MGRGPNRDRETITKAKEGGSKLILKGKGEKAPPKCAKSYTFRSRFN